MTFNSLFFMFVFLPIVLILQFVIQNRTIQNILLVLFSFLFYSWLNPVSAILLVLFILWNYFTGLEIENSEGTSRTVAFVLGVAVQVLVLCCYKYLNFIFGFLPSISFNLNVPMGLSFFTFSCISYLADVFMNKSKAQSNLLNLAVYISFFGKISMGPIVQYHDMEEQIKNRSINIDLLGMGLKLFVIGLVKKVVFADQLALLHSNLSTSTSVIGAWLFAISYMLQIYFDFSGYSDMAIGLSNMFGFEFEKNFDHPYVATSIQDFWRRWHISLSRWFRDYIYIPLGGSRVDNALYIRNIFVVWLLTGIWHGANFTFIVWGLYFGVLLLLEKYFIRDILNALPKFVGRIYTLFLVLISWIFFMSDSLLSAFKTIGSLVGIGVKGFADSIALFNLKGSLILIILSIIFSTPIYGKFEEIVYSNMKRSGVSLFVVLYVILFIVALSFVVSSTFQSFLYFAF